MNPSATCLALLMVLCPTAHAAQEGPEPFVLDLAAPTKALPQAMLMVGTYHNFTALCVQESPKAKPELMGLVSENVAHTAQGMAYPKTHFGEIHVQVDAHNLVGIWPLQESQKCYIDDAPYPVGPYPKEVQSLPFAISILDTRGNLRGTYGYKFLDNTLPIHECLMGEDDTDLTYGTLYEGGALRFDTFVACNTSTVCPRVLLMHAGEPTGFVQITATWQDNEIRPSAGMHPCGGSRFVEPYEFDVGVRLIGCDGMDTLVGTRVDDHLFGGSMFATPDPSLPCRAESDDGDLLFGSDGEDIIYGEMGPDMIWGGIGDDWLHGGGNTCPLCFDTADDTIYGGPDNDVIYGDNPCIRAGTDEDDYPRASEYGPDMLYGEGGDDRIYAGPGPDFLLGGTGEDLLMGEEGNDEIRGWSGPPWDDLVGGEGRDTLIREPDSEDRLYCDLDDMAAGGMPVGACYSICEPYADPADCPVMRDSPFWCPSE